MKWNHLSCSDSAKPSVFRRAFFVELLADGLWEVYLEDYYLDVRCCRFALATADFCIY